MFTVDQQSRRPSALAELAVSDRPRRDRANEAAEQRRRERQARGRCIDCGERPFTLLPSGRRRFKRTQRCDECRARVEANTARDPHKRERKGRLSIADCDRDDAKLAMRALCAGFAALDEISGRGDLTRNDRKRMECEPLSQVLLGVRSAFAIAKRRGIHEDWLDAIEQALTGE